MNGDASIQKRPMGRVMKPLREMGASIEGRDDNFCPLTMHPSELHGIEYRLPVASAQLKSAILLAGLYAEGQTTVIEPAPSRDHTERMFRALGVEIETNGNVITLEPPEDLHAVDIAVPARYLLRGVLPRRRRHRAGQRADHPERRRQSDAHGHSGCAAQHGRGHHRVELPRRRGAGLRPDRPGTAVCTAPRSAARSFRV